MKRKIITTGDRSTTIHLVEWNEQYHSKHGAIQEAYHVFINKGLHFFCSKQSQEKISILEIGFGTGLNALITAIESYNLDRKISYVGVEAYPIAQEEMDQLNYAQLLPNSKDNLFRKLHSTPWEVESEITSNFSLKKQQMLFSEIKDKNAFDIIYFDAFGARVQPELWTAEMFQIINNALKPQGVLVTYSAKGSVKRAMLSVGLSVERLDGPPGKRHMLRATK